MNDKLNGVIEKLIYLYQKYCPLPIQRFITNTRQAFINGKANSINWVKTKSINTWKTIPLFFQNLSSSLGNIQGYLTHLVLSFKKFKKEQGNLKAILGTILAIIASYLYEVKVWYSRLQTSAVVVAMTTTSVVAFSAWHIYYKGNTLYSKLGRKPASVDPSTFVDVRPQYYKKNEKHFTVYHVKMPLFIESIKGNKSVKMDVTVEPSNKYIKEFFYKNEYLVHDKINIMTHPIIPSLPLTEEGKVIIKEKLKTELNNLIKEQKIEGKINEVYINSILGT